jgi:hypothetical protein
VSNGTHTAPRAEQRRAKNGVRGPAGAVPAEQSLARIIGETVALRMAEVVPELTWTPGCLPCAREAKRAERDHSIAVAIATKAAEPLPDVPHVQVNQAFTIGPDGPVCWAHVEPGE